MRPSVVSTLTCFASAAASASLSALVWIIATTFTSLRSQPKNETPPLSPPSTITFDVGRIVKSLSSQKRARSLFQSLSQLRSQRWVRSSPCAPAVAANETARRKFEMESLRIMDGTLESGRDDQPSLDTSTREKVVDAVRRYG